MLILFRRQISWDKVLATSYLVELDIHIFSKNEQSSVGCIMSCYDCKLGRMRVALGYRILECRKIEEAKMSPVTGVIHLERGTAT